MKKKHFFENLFCTELKERLLAGAGERFEAAGHAGVGQRETRGETGTLPTR